MTTERKILIIAALLCMVGICTGLMAAAINPARFFLPGATFALLCAWVGAAIGDVLRKNPDK